MKFCLSFGVTSKDSWRLISLTLNYSLAVRSKTKRVALQSDNQVHSIQAIYNNKVFPLHFRRQDLSMLYEVWMDQNYDLKNKKLTSGKILDIGAHVGFTTLYYWTQLGEDRHYICIEGSVKNSRILNKNINIIAQSTIHQCIITHDGRQVRFYDEMSGHLHTVHDTLGDDHDSESMNTIMSRYKNAEIALCKMDIEGMEYEVLTKHNSWLKSVAQLCLELHNQDEYNTIEKSLFEIGMKASYGSAIKYFIRD